MLEVITDQTIVRSPKSGKPITIATAVRQGFMKEIARDGFKTWEWADHAFPSETQHEKFERSESQRILNFIKENSDLPHPWDLGAIIKTDNGRLRLWFEISEHTSSDEDSRRLDQLKEWKQRLVRFDGKRDPQPYPISFILHGLEQASMVSDRLKNRLIADEINSWVAKRLDDWKQGKGEARMGINIELFDMLRLCGVADEPPVNRKVLMPLARTRKKKR